MLWANTVQTGWGWAVVRAQLSLWRQYQRPWPDPSLEASRQADSGNVMLGYSGPQHGMAHVWGTFGGRSVVWTSCLHSRTVSAVICTSYNCKCPHSTLQAAAEPSALSSDILFAVTANLSGRSFNWTLVIRIWFIFEVLFCQIRLHYLLICRNRICIEYLVQPFLKLKLSHFIHLGISEISLCSPGLIVLIFIWNNVSQTFLLFYFLNYYMACYLRALRKRKGKEDYLCSAILVHTHTLKVLRRQYVWWKTYV